ncbi:MAG: hypothetical protein U0694_06100 [Anaerolineae bacterium]
MYKFDLNIGKEILYWQNIFMSLSLKQFKQVYDYLNFPFDPPENIRQIAHDFAFTLENLHAPKEFIPLLENLRQNGERASVNLLEGISQNDTYKKKLRYCLPIPSHIWKTWDMHK